MNKYIACFLLFPSLFLVSCDNTILEPIPKDECESGIFPEPTAGNHPSTRIWIANEGNFQWGNASLGWYDPVNGTYLPDVFDSINQQPLGDVFQSMAFYNGKAFLVVNNSGKIEVVNLASGQREAIITGLTSPRYLLPLSATKAYVSDLYANAISVVDLQSNQVTGSIPLPGWTERMTQIDSLAFVTNVKTEYLYLINIHDDGVLDSINVGLGSSQVVRDADGMLWVGCDGDPLNQQGGQLVRVNPQTRQVTARYEFPHNERPSRLTTGPEGRHLYYLNDGCFVVPIDRDSLPECPIIPSEGGLFYGLGIDPNNGDIYVSDAIDYVQRGIILRYDKSGKFLGEFLAGLIPGGFGFE